METPIALGSIVKYTGKLLKLEGRVGVVTHLSPWTAVVDWEGVGGPISMFLSEVAPYTGESAPETGARIPCTLPEDSDSRKQYPIAEVVFGQFPAAIIAVSHHSYKGNNKHNPGLPLQDNRSKSTDDANCLMRHLAEGDYEAVAWRALRLLQRKLEEEGAPVAPLATHLPKE